jgi:trimeric autotransporter adhesin
MTLPVTIPNTFANATASIPLANLDTNFTTLANAVNGISDGSETLANVSATTITVTNDATINGLTVGEGAGSISTNTAVGANALDANTTGIRNTAVGYQSLYANTTGTENVSVGAYSLDANESGSANTALGDAALSANTTANNNTAIGSESLKVNTTGTANTALGKQSLWSNTTGASNTAVGYQSLYANTTGANNTAVGYAALGANETGTSNTAVGTRALDANTTGSTNTALGIDSLGTITTGQECTAVGKSALFLATGGKNTAIGKDCGDTLTTGSNCALFGYNAQPSSASATNEITLGDANISNLRCNDTSISSLSDIRDKINIEDIPFGLDYVNAMRPVKFDWNRRDNSYVGKKDFGFIAQELDEVQNTFGLAEYTRLVHKNNPDKWEADPMKTYPILIKAIQELSAQVTALQTEVNTLKGN